MAGLFYPLAAVLVLAMCAQSGQALLCFECNSHNDSRCALDIPPDELKKDCSDHIEGTKFTMCRKITQSIEFEVNGLPPDSRVIRGCGWEESTYKGKCYQRSGFGGRQEVCSCLSDLCNGAPGATLGPMASLQAAVLATLGVLIGQALL